MPINNSVREQFRRNAVAIISLAVAITGLSYNTWRNEASEDNRTQRLVSIEVLMRLADLQRLVWHHHWDKDTEDRGNLRTGWTLVLVIKDISQILGDPLPESTQALWRIWGEHADTLENSRAAETAIIDAINVVRADALALLQELD
ncbi:MAG: hypothetical protein OEM51_04565 [Gammaproteobacteria bacterium]|nr:hypothetical protein [Gammaproteobacteria bacterium]MDH3431319.1 hypothetical protein [Gammaproteobacteria bacterium]